MAAAPIQDFSRSRRGSSPGPNQGVFPEKTIFKVLLRKYYMFTRTRPYGQAPYGFRGLNVVSCNTSGRLRPYGSRTISFFVKRLAAGVADQMTKKLYGRAPVAGSDFNNKMEGARQAA